MRKKLKIGSIKVDSGWVEEQNMGKITIRETSQVGESRSEVEYIFEDSSDYFAWSEQKTEALNNAIKSYVGGLGSLVDEPMLADIQVKKKDTKH